jgi:hypothetical protein
MGKVWAWLLKNATIIVVAGDLIVEIGKAIRETLKPDTTPKA